MFITSVSLATAMVNYTDTQFIQELPSGPLDTYRAQASFDWKKLKLIFEDSERLKIKFEVWQTLENDPIFQRPAHSLSTDEQKCKTAMQVNRFRKYSFIPGNTSHTSLIAKLKHIMCVGQALVVAFPDVTVKYFVEPVLFQLSIITLGTEKHNHIVEAAWKGQLSTAFALTEIAHGSDVKNMRTTATYDQRTQEFVLNTPDFQAAKCWAANLGKSCTIAIVFAQLYTKGTCHGLHAFVVPIRDPKTLLPYPGVTVGDGGEKIGLNGVDNGFVMFRKYRIPRDNLLNRVANVTREGDYKSSLSGPDRLLSSTLGNLLTGRIGVIQESSEYLIIAVSIAVRYAAVRKQFGNRKDKEIAIIEYPLHQWRLFRYLAAAAVLKIFSTKITSDYIDILNQSLSDTSDHFQEVRQEMHALISATKPLVTWTCQAAIQESREACGGHGYLKAARFGNLRNTNDPRATYEGDNNILLQQTSRWLLKQWNGVKQGIPVCSPLNSCAFLNNHSQIESKKFMPKQVDDVTNFKFLAESYEWLIIHLLQESDAKLRNSFDETRCLFTAFNNSQVYKASVLSRVYVEYTALVWYWKKISDGDVETNLRPILEKLGILYGLSCLDKHLVYFYMGNFSLENSLGKLVKDGILDLCASLKSQAVAVVDALAPPDFALNSVLGKSDGRLYENLEAEFFSDPDALSRPKWWKEVRLDGVPDLKITSKL